MARKAAHQDKAISGSHSNFPYECEASQVRLRSNSTAHLTIKFQQPYLHVKPISQASKCADPSCEKRFVVKIDRPRNCSMCGEVFCHQCANYRRKLSISAYPDPFGTLCNVCRKCYNYRAVSGVHRDHFDEFKRYRGEKLSADEAEVKRTLCGGKHTTSKRKAILKEIERLTEGFAANSGFLKGLMSEIVVPDWQKSANWVESDDASECYQCKKTFTKLPPSRKIHCRIGGQVFCTECSRNEIVVYLESKDGKPRWSINGMDGGQVTTPVRLELYPICSSCSADLQVILSERLSSSCQSSTFMDDIHEVHQRLAKLREKVDRWLPEYQQVVDTLDVDISVKDIEEQQKIAKLHLDLFNVLSDIRCMSVEDLSCYTLSPFENCLLKNMKTGRKHYYEEQSCQFCCTQQLSEHMPHDDKLREIQEVSSQQTMESVYAEISQLVKEVLSHMYYYDFEGTFSNDIVGVVCSVKEDLSLKDKRWEQRSTRTRTRMAGETSRINLSQEVMMNPEQVRYVVISQCSTVIRECYLRLEAKTLDREFEKTKKCLDVVWSKLESTLQQFNTASHTCRW